MYETQDLCCFDHDQAAVSTANRSGSNDCGGETIPELEKLTTRLSSAQCIHQVLVIESSELNPFMRPATESRRAPRTMPNTCDVASQRQGLNLARDSFFAAEKAADVKQQDSNFQAYHVRFLP